MTCQVVPTSRRRCGTSPSARRSRSSSLMWDSVAGEGDRRRNWVSSSAYGFVMPNSGLVSIRIDRRVGDVDRRVVDRDV